MKKKLITIVLSIAFLAISVFLSVGWVNNKAKPNKSDLGSKLVMVKTSVVKNEFIPTTLIYPGRINSFENIAIAAEVNGKIMQGNVPFKEGQSFRKSDLLLHIYDLDVRAGLKSSKSNFLKTLSLILPDMSVDYPESYEIWDQFFSSIKLDEPLPKLPEIANEKEKVFLASNGVLSEYYALQQKDINLTRYNIYAPFEGYFKTVKKEVGAIANVGAELANIIRSDKLEIVVPVLVTDAKRIAVGQEVVISENQQEYKGKVSRKAGFVDASTQSVNIYISYSPKIVAELLEGEYVDVAFLSTNSQAGFKVPRESLIKNEEVFLLENSKLKKAKVGILQLLDDYIIISKLNDGDTLVTESLVNVKEGQRVSAFQQ